MRNAGWCRWIGGRRGWVRLARGAALLGALLLPGLAAAQGSVLYAAVNNAVPRSGATNSDLVTLDPLTGAIVSVIGQTGFVIADLAFDPTTGTLYASTARAALSNPNSLIRIDPTTGVGTLIGPFNVGGRTLAGLAFDASGTLYGWESRSDSQDPNGFYDANLCTVDLATGTATLVGDWDPTDPETRGNGIAFDAAGTLFWSGRTWFTDALNTVDPSTGLVTGSLPLTGPTFGTFEPLASLTFDADGTLYGLKDFGNQRTPELLVIDTQTGATAVVGALPSFVNGIAFGVCDQPVCLGPLLALNPPGTQHLLVATVTDAEGDPVSGEPVDFSVLSGPNAGTTGNGTTDAEGRAVFVYLGSGGEGVDRIQAATATDLSPEVRKFWDTDCNGNRIADTCDLSCDGFGGECSLVRCGQSADGNTDGVPDECLPPVGVDIRPGFDPNFINVNTADKLEVAILGAEGFDATAVDVSTLAFGPAAAAPFLWAGTRVEDVDLDDFDDFVVYFRLEQSGIGVGDAQACLTGELLDGTPFEGCDGVSPVACGLGFEVALLLPPLAWWHARRRRR